MPGGSQDEPPPQDRRISHRGDEPDAAVGHDHDGDDDEEDSLAEAGKAVGQGGDERLAQHRQEEGRGVDGALYRHGDPQLQRHHHQEGQDGGHAWRGEHSRRGSSRGRCWSVIVRIMLMLLLLVDGNLYNT